ncbi:glycosyl hydrolase 115 family protein [Mucilaginibacter sp. RS28]|uniref:Glycosyl hydrolase 115 family protein n=1 Tax=Mucilaginibacter straminoryzae TaxID=2932774 RepID=A0A9X1X1C6_9SPHI|nr:glycosyl hydrolase 115 family protein [Mucilaginibacter straminoryzae]MCJ8208976.1 glycosyl hydrolase 115 family protein [Mucilaginibacter straminoryzae]
MKKIAAVLLGSLLCLKLSAQVPGHKSYISEQAGAGYFPLSAKGFSAPIYLEDADFKGVKYAVQSLVNDVKQVTGTAPVVKNNLSQSGNIVLVGTIGKNSKIDELISRKKINVADIKGKWETYLIQVVKNPFPGVNNALVIAGSDKRGTIFGVYDLSAQIGVSPWYWWADVPAKHKKAVYVMPGRYTDGEPAVKYRGIFINDEAPAFSGWAKEKFGGVNHLVYEKVFELILRLKGNYLWPAMWGNAFNDDDKQNPVLADEYGVVMGTSHHEPMDRSQQEWKRYGSGQWNYEANKQVLQDFWRKGIENMGSKETIVTMGMRGDGDMPMTEGSNISLLENIVKDQRQIISEVTHKDPSATPQMWALYKEVQEYYDKGMRVPDDVTLLLCDDNWGNIRKLPSLTEKKRSGGYGIYYHFDYVGGPRNYKWLNTNPIAKVWEQMHLAYEYNARQIWIVNVGDLKPMEYPISFFMDYAWNPDKWSAEQMKGYGREWAVEQFGAQYAAEIADILTLYTKYNGRRKPELLNQNTYSLTNYNEFATVVGDYKALLKKAERLSSLLPPQYKDAYYELVLHPVQACANLNELYFEAAKNKFYADKGYADEANAAAAKVKELFDQDKKISAYYNNELAGGKWHHMMDQTHIGYTYWQEPRADKIPALTEIPDSAKAKNQPATPAPKFELAESEALVRPAGSVFAEKDGAIAMEAEFFSKAVSGKGISWQVIPQYGRTLSGVTPWPVTAARVKPGAGTPYLEYTIAVKDTGMVDIAAYVSPTLDFRNKDGLFYAISVDGEEPQQMNIATKVDGRDWSMAVSESIRKLTTKHHIKAAGTHTIKYWMVDPAVVLQRLVVNLGGLKPSYLGPPQN